MISVTLGYNPAQTQAAKKNFKKKMWRHIFLRFVNFLFSNAIFVDKNSLELTIRHIQESANSDLQNVRSVTKLLSRRICLLICRFVLRWEKNVAGVNRTSKTNFLTIIKTNVMIELQNAMVVRTNVHFYPTPN